MNTHETAMAAEQANRRPHNRPHWGFRIDYDLDEAGNRHPVLRLAEGASAQIPLKPFAEVIEDALRVKQIGNGEPPYVGAG
jgi:hypothetical protein